MKDPTLESVHAHAATKNRTAVLRSDQAGCFHCLEKFPAKDVVDYTPDTTAVCPKCGMDSVVGDASTDVTDAFLVKMHRYWFGTAVRE